MEAIIELGDFQIRDKWSMSPYMDKFVEAKEESNNDYMDEIEALSPQKK